MASEREKLLKDLAVSYDVFMELTGNLEEGTKVYNLTLAKYRIRNFHPMTSNSFPFTF